MLAIKNGIKENEKKISLVHKCMYNLILTCIAQNATSKNEAVKDWWMELILCIYYGHMTNQKIKS